MNTQPSQNPLLARIKLPGRVFQLPSKGVFYQPGVLDDTVKSGEIHVRPLSALAELKLKSPDLLYSNKVLGEICQECVPEILKPEALLSKDVDALFLFLMAATNGDQRTIRSLHTCSDAKIHDYVIDLAPILSSPNNASIDHRDVTYSVTLKSGEVITLRPVTFNDAIEMTTLRASIMVKESEDPHTVTIADKETVIVRDLMSIIESVVTPEGVIVTQAKFIEEWARTLSRTDVENLVNVATTANDWGYSFKVNLKCKDCGSEYVHDLELNPVNFLYG